MDKPQIFNNRARKNLARHVSQLTMAQTRQAAEWSEAVGLDPQKLGRIIRQSNRFEGIQEYFTLLEELEERDSHILSIIGTRKRTVCQMEITVDGAEGKTEYDEHARLIQEFINRDDLDGILFDMLDALGKGYSITETIWETSAKQWMPQKLIRADQRFFEIDKTDGRTLRLMGDANDRYDLDPYKFIIHNAPAKSGFPIRGGVLRPCLWMSLFKTYQFKDWVIFNEAYNQPMRLGKYHAGASDEEKRVLLQAVHNIGSDAAGIIPENMTVEFIEAAAKASSEGSYHKLINLCDLQSSKAVLGQTTTTDAISGGHAVSKEHNEVRKDIAVSDAKKLAYTLNHTIVRWIIDFNFGPQEKYPTIAIGLSEEIDQEQFGKNVDRGRALGLPMSASGVANTLGIPAPDSPEDTIGYKQEDDPEEETTASQKQNTSHHHALANQQNHAPDVFERASDEMAEDYEEIINPILEIVNKARIESASYEEFNQRLLELASDLDMSEAAEKITNMNFMANIAGQVDAKFEE